MLKVEGGLAWIRHSNGSIEAGPLYRLPSEYDGKIVRRVVIPSVPLSEITDPEIRALVSITRARTQMILDRAAQITAQLREKTKLLH